MYLLNPESEFLFRIGRKCFATNLAALRAMFLHGDWQEWGIKQYKNLVKPGDFVLVRIGGEARKGGAALLRVVEVDGDLNVLRMDFEKEAAEALINDPLEHRWLLDTLDLPTCRGKVLPIVHAWPAIRKEIEKRLPRKTQERGGTRSFEPNRTPRRPKPGELGSPEEKADARGNAVEGHQDLLVGLHERLVALGTDPSTIEENPTAFDLRVAWDETTWIFEVKTTDANLLGPIRLGVGQLLDYQANEGPADARLCLVTDRLLEARHIRLLNAMSIACIARVQGK